MPVWWGFWEDGRVGSTRNLSAHLGSSCIGRIQCNCIGTLESAEGLQLPVEALDHKLQSVLVSFNHGRQPCTYSWSSLHIVWDPGWTQRTLSSTYHICADHWLLLLITEVLTEGWVAFVVAPPPLLQAPPPLAEVTLKGLRGLAPSSPLSLSSLSPFWNQTLKTKTFKSNHIYRGISHPACPGREAEA